MFLAVDRQRALPEVDRHGLLLVEEPAAGVVAIVADRNRQIEKPGDCAERQIGRRAGAIGGDRVGQLAARGLQLEDQLVVEREHRRGIARHARRSVGQPGARLGGGERRCGRWTGQAAGQRDRSCRSGCGQFGGWRGGGIEGRVGGGGWSEIGPGQAAVARWRRGQLRDRKPGLPGFGKGLRRSGRHDGGPGCAAAECRFRQVRGSLSAARRLRLGMQFPSLDGSRHRCSRSSWAGHYRCTDIGELAVAQRCRGRNHR